MKLSRLSSSWVAALALVAAQGSFAIAQPAPVDPPPATAPEPGDDTVVPPAPAATPPEQPAADPLKSAAPGDDLSVEQGRLADRYKRLEEVVGKLAELSASSDPRRAKLLREAIAQSREQDINVRFESVVKLLQDERLSAAAKNQTDLQKDLDGLLALLLKADRDNELNTQRDRVKAYLKEVGRLIREQKSVRARTQGGDELKSLGQDQQRISADTAKLGGSISKTEGGNKKNGEPKDGESSKRDKNDGEQSKNSEKGSEKESKREKTDKSPADKQKWPDGDRKSNDKQADKKNDIDVPGIQKPNDSKNGKPSDSGKPTDSQKPNNGSKPSDSKSQPGEGQPSESKPSEGQPGQPGDSQPSQSPPKPGQPGSPSPSGGESDKQDQQPPEPQDPADRATEQLKKAQQQMEEARKKLEEAQRKGATDRQQEAIKQLEQAKAELERILRQLREEELERTLTQLAARFRKMLEMQTAVYDGTVKLDQVPAADRTHDHEIESARLSREESQIVHEVEKALSLLHEEGSSVAFPETIDQMRDDMHQVAERLAAIKVDKLTQGIEQDIISALEETIAALDKSIKDLDKKRTPPGQQPAAGQPGEMPLVDKLAELKMIRSLQMRINKRTKTYGDMIKGEQAETPDLLKSLDELAERQQRVYRATADLQQKRND